MAWGKCFCITFIVLSSQSFIYFVPKCRIQLIRLVCLVFSLQNAFVHPWLLFREDHFSLLPQSPGSYPNSNVVWPQIKLSNCKYFCFFYCLISQFVYYQKILYSFLKTCFHLLILGSLYMLKTISIILKKVFWTITGETTLVCLSVKPSCVLVLLLALTNLFVHSSIFVLIFRKEQPNLSSCKVLFLFHNCYHQYC